jgi:drug/metabolite transporter (DMT)-like permease
MTRAGAVAAMVGSAACWGGATVMSKAALGTIPPFQLLAIQLAASVAALWLAVALWRPVAAPGRAVRAAPTGLLEPGLAYAAGVPGLALTTAANATVIAALEPVLIIALLAALAWRWPDGAVAAAALAAVAGVCLLSLPGAVGLGAGDLWGDALVLAGTGFAALYVVASARAVAGVPPLLLTAAQQTAGLGLVLALGGGVLLAGAETWARPPAPVLALAVASGLVQYALAFFLYLTGLRRFDPATAGLFLTLAPLFGIGGAVAFLGERLAPLQLFGAAVTVAAVALVVRRG